MRTKVGVFFGGRSVEHEISVISALQAIAALDAARYQAIPVYITKQGRWFTGPALLDTAAYRDMEALTRRATEVYMRPVFGERTLYASRRGMGPIWSAPRKVATIDVALPVLHGTNGEDGSFQGLLELVGIPYAGCNPLSSAVGMDKIAMKMMLRQSAIPVIDYVWFTDREWNGATGRDKASGGRGREALIARIEAETGYPAIVKPANLGSSVGISRARNRDELLRAVEEASRYSTRILVERMIEPLREINCSVLGSADDHRTSVCEEPLRSGEILSYADKYMSGGGTKGAAGKYGAAVSVSSDGGSGGAKVVSGGMSSTKRRIPADLPAETAEEIRRLAAETFRVLGCEGVARVDFILETGTGRGESGASDTGGSGSDTGGVKIYVNEINTIPGSLSFYLWEATGLPFGELMDSLIARALKRERDKSYKTVSYDGNIFSMGSPGGGKSGGYKSGYKTGGAK